MAEADIPTVARICELCPPDFEASELATPSRNALSYVPAPYQERFHEMESRSKAAICGLGVGKTTMGAYEAFLAAVAWNPEPHVGIIGAPTFPMLRDSVVPVVREVFPPECLAGGRWDSAFSASTMTLRLVTGSVAIFRSLDGNNYHRVRGIEAAWCWVDEAGLLKTRDAWGTTLGRLRGRARKRYAWATMTPNGENWAAEDWILSPKPGYEHVHATSYDCPWARQDYLRELEGSLSEAMQRQELMGEVVSLQGAVYSDLSSLPWPAGNVLVYDPDPKRPTILEVDFGFRRPAVHLVQQLDVLDPATGEATKLDCVVGELQGRNGKWPQDMKVSEWLEQVHALRFNIVAAYGDPAGDAENDQTHMTSARLLVDKFQVPFHKPTADWERSKERGEEVVRSQIKPYRGHRRLVWAARPEKDGRGNHLLHAPNSFRAFRNLQYPERKPGMPTKNESLKDGIHDHDTDASRYRIVKMYGRSNIRSIGQPVAVA